MKYLCFKCQLIFVILFILCLSGCAKKEIKGGVTFTKSQVKITIENAKLIRAMLDGPAGIFVKGTAVDKEGASKKFTVRASGFYRYNKGEKIITVTCSDDPLVLLLNSSKSVDGSVTVTIDIGKATERKQVEYTFEFSL